ncbi:MAG: site-specific integrase [Myxococcota bacterium]
MKVYSDEEVRALKRACLDEPLGRLFILMFDTGLRPGEALGLKWGDIGGEVLRVRRQLWEYEGKLELRERLKTENSRRDIFLAPATLEQLGQPGPLGELIFRDSGGWLQRKRRVYQAWKRVHDRADVDKNGRTPHCARHSHASQLLTDGVPIGDVAARLGDTIRTVQLYYAHWMPGEDRSRSAVAARAGVSVGGSRTLQQTGSTDCGCNANESPEDIQL